MDYKNVKKEFEEFKKEKGEEALLKIDDFFETIKKKYLKERTQDYLDQGYEPEEAHNKARQSWRAKVGDFLEQTIKTTIEDLCEEYEVSVTSDSKLKKENLEPELDLVRRMLEIHYDNYSFLPDADLILYKYDQENDQVKILCVLSLKTSFRERYTETPYWKLKLKRNQRTSGIKVFMITPDNSDEISYTGESDDTNKSPRKARIVMEYELDGIYLTREEFDSSKNIKGIDKLHKDLLKIFKNNQ